MRTYIRWSRPSRFQTIRAWGFTKDSDLKKPGIFEK